MLLVAFLGNPAAAAETTELQKKTSDTGAAALETEAAAPRPKSKNAEKVLVLLGNIGINNRDVHNLVDTVDSRVDKGYLRFSEQQITEQGKLTFRYRLKGSVDPVWSQTNKQGIRRLELNYSPGEDSRWQATATRKYVVVNYRIPLGDTK